MKRLAWRRRILGGAIGAAVCAPGLGIRARNEPDRPGRHGSDDIGDRPGADDVLFYCGMVRKKNILATMAQTPLCTMLCSLAFSGDGAILGTLERSPASACRPQVRSR